MADKNFVKNAQKAGYSQQEINQFLAKKAASSAPKNEPKKVGGMKGLVAGLLPLVGGTVGAVGGGAIGALAGGVGAIPGAAVGGAGGSALGEFARQKLLGEKTNYGSIAGQAALGAIPGVAGGVVKGARALPAVINGGKVVAQAANTAKTASAAQKALQGSESMAAATKAASVPKVGKVLPPTRTTGPMELQPTKTIVNPTVGQTKDLANSSMGVKTGRLQTDAYNTPFIQSGKTPVNRGTTMDVNAPLKVEKPTLAPAPKVEAPVKATAPKEIAPAAVSEPLPAKPVGKLEKSAQNSENNRAQSLFGKDNTTTKEYQKPLNDTRRKELAAYTKSKGITATQPQKAAEQLEANHQKVTKNLKETLKRTNRPVTQAERNKLAKEIETAWAKDTNVASSNPKLKQDILKRIRNAEDSKDLESLAKYRSSVLDTGAKYNAMGDAAGTANSTINKAARDAISKFTGKASPEYKAAQQEFRLSKEATARANASSGRVVDAKLPIVNLPIRGSGQSVEGTLNKARDAKVAITRKIDKAANGTGEAGVTPSKTGFMPYVKAGVKQGLSRAIVGPLLPEGMKPEEAQATVDAVDQYDGMETPEITPETPQGPFSNPDTVQQAYMAALADGDTQAAKMIMDGYKMFGPEATASANKPLSAESSKVISNANSGLTSLAQLREIMQSDPSAQTKQIIPGQSMFGGAVGSALGTSSYNSAQKNIVDVITRLRTGAAITESEEQFYRSMMPQAFDPPETVSQKLDMFQNLFESVANRTGTAGNDTQSLVGL